MPVDESQIWQILHNYDKFINRTPLIPSKQHKSIGYASEFFQYDELPEKVLDVEYTWDETPGYLWVTNKRVVFVGAKSLIGKEPVYKEFMYGSITAIIHNKKLGGFDKIVLSVSTSVASGHVEQVEFKLTSNAKREKVIEFVEYVRTKVANWSGTSSRDTPNKEESDLVGELERLGKLRHKGLISEDEFQVAKRKLLGI